LAVSSACLAAFSSARKDRSFSVDALLAVVSRKERVQRLSSAYEVFFLLCFFFVVVVSLFLLFLSVVVVIIVVVVVFVVVVIVVVVVVVYNSPVSH
jgi:hypothetical protein